MQEEKKAYFDIIKKASNKGDLKWSQFYFKNKANKIFLNVKGKNRESWFKDFVNFNTLKEKDQKKFNSTSNYFYFQIYFLKF